MSLESEPLAVALEMLSRRDVCLRERRCVSCGCSVGPHDFRDALSAREYGLSALCQKCQDVFFGEEER